MRIPSALASIIWALAATAGGCGSPYLKAGDRYAEAGALPLAVELYEAGLRLQLHRLLPGAPLLLIRRGLNASFGVWRGVLDHGPISTDDAQPTAPSS